MYFSVKGASGKFQCCLTKFQRSFKEVSRVFQDSFMGVSRKIEGLKGDFGRFQGYLKEVSKVCQGCFNGVSGSFKEVSRKFQECLKKVSRVLQDSFKGVSKKIEGYFEGDFSGF